VGFGVHCVYGVGDCLGPIPLSAASTRVALSRLSGDTCCLVIVRSSSGTPAAQFQAAARQYCRRQSAHKVSVAFILGPIYAVSIYSLCSGTDEQSAIATASLWFGRNDCTITATNTVYAVSVVRPIPLVYSPDFELRRHYTQRNSSAVANATATHAFYLRREPFLSVSFRYCSLRTGIHIRSLRTLS